jgi:hypothetical protein
MFYAPDDGQLVLAISEARTNLKKDDIWGIMSPEGLNLEEEILNTRAEIISRNRELVQSVESPQAIVEVKEKLSETERLISRIEALNGFLEDGEMLRELLPHIDTGDIASTQQHLRQQADILRRKIELLFSGQTATTAELDLADANLRQSRLELKLKRQRMEMKMPFDGLLHCNIDLRNTHDSPFVERGQLIGVAEDLSGISANVEMIDSGWLGFDPESVVFLARIEDDQRVGSFQRSTLKEQAGQDYFVYHFEFEEAVSNFLRGRRNSEMGGEIAVDLEVEAYIVPKIDLILFQPETFKTGQWTLGIRRIWPTAKVVAIGPYEIAISIDD